MFIRQELLNDDHLVQTEIITTPCEVAP